jgi:hemoglobin
VHDPELCREDEIVTLVHRFYASVRRDPALGPVFDAHVADWDHHLAKMCDFWSSVLLGTARYRGTPMPKHVKLPALTPALFRRWLELFHATTQALGNPGLQARPTCSPGASRRVSGTATSSATCPASSPSRFPRPDTRTGARCSSPR